MYGVSCRCDGPLIWGNGFGSLRRSYKSPTTDRSRGRHPRLRPLKRACWSELTMAGSPRTGRMRRMGLLKLPYTLTSENAQHCLPAAHCIRATLFGKVDDLQFAPLRGHILIRKSACRMLD